MEKHAAPQTFKDKLQLMQLIVFRVGDEEFGVPIEAVQEIIKIGLITPIPDSPEFIKGLINVRGDIVAVIDVRARFFLSTHDDFPKHIIIAKQNGNLFGLMVDEVIEVLRVQESEVKPPPQLMTKIHEEYVHGVLTHEGRLIILLDLNQVLSEEELIRLADLTRAHHSPDEVKSQAEAYDLSMQEKSKTVRGKKKKDNEPH